MIPGAWSTAIGRATRRGDPMRLGIMMVAFVLVPFNLRFLLVPPAMVCGRRSMSCTS